MRQFTAVDTATRAAVVDLVVDNHTAEAAAAFIDLAIERFAEMAVELAGVLTDRGPEFVGRPFQDHRAELDSQHTNTPRHSPNHNAVCERFHGTVLHDLYRPTFQLGLDGRRVGGVPAASSASCRMRYTDEIEHR